MITLLCPRRVLFPLMALCALLSATAQAQGRHMGQQMGRDGMEVVGPRMMMDADEMCPMVSGPALHGYPWRMNLTDDQRKQAEQIFDHARTRIRANHEQMIAAQAKLRDALNKPKRDRAEIMNAYREVEQLRARSFEYHLDAQQQFDQLTVPAK